MSKKITTYSNAAGGWGALASTAKHLMKSDNIAKNIRNLLNTNQDDGFDCPGCAWGEDDSPGHFKFCENGAKAVNWEATGKRIPSDFFAKKTVSELKEESGHFLESLGRLHQPLSYNRKQDKYEVVSWDEAFNLIGLELNKLESPEQAEFYTSGRTSNEAAFLYQLFVRLFGCNNFADCSNMCHEASGVALRQALGVGEGSIQLIDFDYADAIFVFGQNPGSNHPRMLDSLYKAAKRGTHIVSFNTLKERGLERFASPQNPIEMLKNGSTAISSMYFMPKLGGDMAVVRGMVKTMLALDKAHKEKGQSSLFDEAFIARHCTGLTEYIAQVNATSWQQIEAQSGLSQEQIAQAAQVHLNSDRVICTWAMGITQHKHSVATIHEIINLQLLRGQVGKHGAGLCPVRGHSNVQGDRTMGINEKPTQDFLHKLGKVFNFEAPQKHGHNTVQAIRAMLNRQSKVFIALGGNFAVATPDKILTEKALSQCELTVHIATKLNRSHLITGKSALILPCLGRTDIDVQLTGPQKVTVEDSFSMVHASMGVVPSETGDMRSEVAIVAGMAEATLGNDKVNWSYFVEDYDRIRDKIEAVLPRFKGFNEKISHPGGFYLGSAIAEHHWQTPSGKAQLMTHALPESIQGAALEGLTQQKIFVLQTLRSHDQYNTTIYGMEDRYRGIHGHRHVLMMNTQDMAALGLIHLDKVIITSIWNDDVTRQLSGFMVIEYDIPMGNVAAYYPEANALVPLDSVGDLSDTPTYKSIVITVEKDETQINVRT